MIYCVEDDDGIRELILCALKSGGYEAAAFEKSSILYGQLEKAVPSLILLDIMLPLEDGMSILKRLRNDTHYKDIPIIMLTAKSSEIDKVGALEAGADDYITKPFGIMELLSRIKAVLRRTYSEENSEEPLFFRDLKLDISKRQVIFNEKNVALTFKEFELLALLMRNKGLVMSRNKILERVWGYDFDGESRTVDMHIKTLRQKLEEVGCDGYITTVRGVGYKLNI
ncbi:MAG: response regulator transcription factor [Oscillospiraceae bacterium]